MFYCTCTAIEVFTLMSNHTIYKNVYEKSRHIYSIILCLVAL